MIMIMIMIMMMMMMMMMMIMIMIMIMIIMTMTMTMTMTITLISRGFFKHFVVNTIGIRKRRFDRSTVIIKQSEDINLHKY